MRESLSLCSFDGNGALAFLYSVLDAYPDCIPRDKAGEFIRPFDKDYVFGIFQNLFQPYCAKFGGAFDSIEIEVKKFLVRRFFEGIAPRD